MKLQTPEQWSSENKSGSGKSSETTLVTAWLLLAGGVVLALVPGLGLAIYLIGIPLILVSLALALAAMIRGRAVGGAILMLVALIAAPVAFGLLPLLSLGISAKQQQQRAAVLETDVVEEEVSTDAEVAENVTTDAESKGGEADPQGAEIADKEEGWITEDLTGGDTKIEVAETDSSQTEVEDDPVLTADEVASLIEGDGSAETDDDLFVESGGLIRMRRWTRANGQQFRASLKALSKVEGAFHGNFVGENGRTFSFAIGLLSEDDISLVKRRLGYTAKDDE